MFALLLLGLSLAPLALLLLFWNMFPQDGSIHPIYRESRVERIAKRTEANDATPQSQMIKIEHKVKLA